MPQDPSRAQSIFIEASAKPSATEQRAFVDRTCGKDLALRDRVLALLKAHDAATADGFLAHQASDETLESADLTRAAPLAEAPGTRIGRYKLLQSIGEGGFGTVFMAEQEQPVRRKVALKIIKLGMDTKQVIARFEAERQALAMMDHPNIAKVLDAGATESGRPYFVMELVSGVPLTEFCDVNSLPTADRLDLFVQVCQAVQHAHTKGIIHRDLKPSNILVTMNDDKPVPKVIDFGIAKATQARLTERTLFTEFKQFIGTPQYTSPEQAQMTGLDVDTRSDVYSLGVVLYELLTGTTPLDPRELRSAAFDQMQRLIREETPPRPSTRLSSLGEQLSRVAAHRRIDPKRLPTLVRGELDWIVMRCLEKDRTRRYESATALAADVRRHLDGDAVLARPTSAPYRFRKFVARHKFGAVAGTAVALAVVLGVTGTAAGLVRARFALTRATTAESQAIHERNLAVELKGKAESVSGELARTVSTLNQRSIDLRHALYINTSSFASSALRTGDTRNAQDLIAHMDPAERGWEWPLLKWQSDRSIDRIDLAPPPDQQQPRLQFVFNPDGSRAASSQFDGSVTIWDARNRRALRTFPAYPADSGSEYLVSNRRVRERPIADMVFTAAYGLLTMPSGRFPAKVWDIETGAERCALSGPALMAQTLRVSPDGKTLIARGDRGNGIYFPGAWDLMSGKSLFDFKYPAVASDPASLNINSISVSPDGSVAASSLITNTSILIWNGRTGAVDREVKFEAASGLVAVGPAGKLLFCTFPPRIVDGLTGKIVKTLDLTDATGQAAFSPDGRRLAIGVRGGLAIVDLVNDSPIRRRAAPRDLAKLYFSDAGKTLIGESYDGLRCEWSVVGDDLFTIRPNGLVLAFDGDAANPMLVVQEPDPNGTGYQMDIPGTSMIYFGTNTRVGRLAWLDAKSGKRIRSKDFGTTVLTEPAYDGKRVAILEKEPGEGVVEQFCRARVFDVKTDAQIGEVRAVPGMARAIAINRDGTHVAIARVWRQTFPAPTSVNIFNLATGTAGPCLDGSEAPIDVMEFSPDGRFLATCGEGEVRLYDAHSSKLLISTKPFITEGLKAFAFTPDSTRVALQDAGHVTVFETATARAVGRFGQGRYEQALACTPDGRRFITAGRASLTIRDATTFDELASIPTPEIQALLVSPDGSRVAGRSEYGQEPYTLFDCTEPSAGIRAIREAVRVETLARQFIRELHDGRSATFASIPLPNREVRARIAADPKLEPAVRSAAAEILRVASPGDDVAWLHEIAKFYRYRAANPDLSNIDTALRLAGAIAAERPADPLPAAVLGEMQYWSGKHDAAAKSFESASKLALQMKAPQAADAPWTNTIAALTYSKHGRREESIARLGVALATPSRDDWHVEISQNPLLRSAEEQITGVPLAHWMELIQSNDPELLVASKELCHRRAALFGRGHPATVRACAAAVIQCDAFGDAEAARIMAREALAGAIIAKDAAKISEVRRPLIDLLRKHGTPADLAEIRSMIDGLSKMNGNGASAGDLDAALYALADVSRRQGDLSKAADALTESFQLRLATDGPAAQSTLEAIEQRAEILSNTGNAAKAEELILKHLAVLAGDDESTWWARERLLTRVRDAHRGNEDRTQWQSRLSEAHRRLCERQIERYGSVLSKRPTDPAALTGRAYARARIGRLKEASDDLQLAIRLDPRDQWHWYNGACLLAYLNDRERYTSHCTSMQLRFGKTEVKTVADRTAKPSLLIAGAGGDLANITRLVDITLAGETDAGLLPWFCMAKGMAEYRAGSFDECIKRMAISRDQLPDVAAIATAELFIAMSHQRLGQVDEARAAWDHASGIVEREVGKAEVDDLAEHGLENWLICQVAKREADELFKSITLK